MNKQKLLKALNISIEDISEDRLVDVLLDAYKAKQDRIAELESANGHERDCLFHERQALIEERKRMQTDPLMFPRGDYYFECDGRMFHITVQGRIEMCERKKSKGVDYEVVARRMSPREWNVC